MEIRYITPEDRLEEISNIYEQSWRYAYQNIIPQSYLDSIPSGAWVENLSRNGRGNIIMVEKDAIIGTSSLCRSRWERYGDYGEIISIYFLPEYIGKGYGKKLLEEAIKGLRALGFKDVLLWVLEDNDRARRFYERNGFTFHGECRMDNIGGNQLREVMYEYRL